MGQRWGGEGGLSLWTADGGVGGGGVAELVGQRIRGGLKLVGQRWGGLSLWDVGRDGGGAESLWTEMGGAGSLWDRDGGGAELVGQRWGGGAELVGTEMGGG